MAQSNISIYITDNSIRIAEIKKSNSSMQVANAFIIPTPPGSFEDGMITNVEKVAAAISEAIGDKKPKLYFTVYSRRIAAKEIDVPYIKKLDALTEMVNANVDEYFPMNNLDEYIIRYSILNTITHEDGRKTYHLCVYAMMEDLVTSYHELAKALKLPLASIDYQINSLYHLAQWQNRHGTSLVLQIDGNVTHISIFHDRAQLFRRSVPYGVDTLAQTFAASKDLNEEKALAILLNEKDSEAVLKKAGAYHSVAALRHEVSAALIDDYLSKDEFQDLMQDYMAAITRVIDFFLSKNNDIHIEKVKVIGWGVKISHIDEMLNKSLGMEVELLKRLSGIHILGRRKIAKISLDDLTNFLPNIGAIIKPLDFRIAEKASFTKGGIGYGLFIALNIIAALGVGGVIAFIYWQQALLEQDKLALTRAISSIRYAEDKYNEYIAANEYYNKVIDFDASTRNENEALINLIQTLEEIMPSGVGIQNLQAGNGIVELAMRSASGKAGVALLIMELKKISWIDEIWTVSVSDGYDELNNVETIFPISFTISNELLEALENASSEQAEEGE
ncbi:MAG: pilus assembly protein PilM [Lachnospiraceae bacterium]|nr:pilus assembly protein PilM [Lachnospiraceae bacterium]